jgi:predicted membrane chloride channel (bestrophin family)
VKTLKRILLIVNIKSLAIAGLAVVSTYLCRRYDITADFPLALVATAIIFPIVFSIGGAYKRREVALREYGNMKAHGRAIYFAARDWLSESDAEIQNEAKQLLLEIFQASRRLFTEPISKMPENEEQVYRVFSKLSLFIKTLRQKGLVSGEASRCNQFLSKTIISFENVKHIYQYRTPRTLRAYSDLFIVLLPIIYGPYFAAVSRESSKGLGYILPVLFSIILVSLDRIQVHLENPFDQVGEDDVMINAEKFVARLDL